MFDVSKLFSRSDGRAHAEYISPQFQKKILAHIIQNALELSSSSLFLAIQGRPGEGKSYQVRAVCQRFGIRLFSISGSALSGPHEGQAIDAIADAYERASAHAKTDDRQRAILIDDFDLSVASTTESREYTVNSQLLSGFLMNLADDPFNCRGNRCVRIPIFLTGNDFTNMYSPLARPGRMDFFSWEPSVEDKIQVVCSIFADFGALRRSDIDTLVVEYSNMPVSFFSMLRKDVVEEAIGLSIDGGKIDLSAVAHEVKRAIKASDVAQLRFLAAKRAHSRARKFLG